MHPAARLFPAIPEEDYQALKRDIAAHGQLVPILVDAEGRIVDGVTRYRACAELGVEPKVDQIGPRDDPVLVAVKANGMRRQLGRDQRAAIAARLLKSVQEALRAAGVKDDPRRIVCDYLCVTPEELSAAEQIAERDMSAFNAIYSGRRRLRVAARAIERRARDAKTVEVKTRGESGEIEQPVDANGTPLTAELAAIFADAAVLDRVAASIRDVADFIRDRLRTDPVADWMDREAVIDQLRRAAKAVKRARPYAVCPFCAGEGCDRVCRRAGWVPREIYERWEKFGGRDSEA